MIVPHCQLQESVGAPMAWIVVVASAAVAASAARFIRKANHFYGELAAADERIRGDDAERAMLSTRRSDRMQAKAGLPSA
jgi:hypothetical protein